MFQKGETYKTIPENMFKMLQPGGTSKWCKMRPLLLTFFLYDGPLYPSSPTPFNPGRTSCLFKGSIIQKNLGFWL